MDTKTQIQTKIDNLEEVVRLMLEEIGDLRSFLEVTYIEGPKKGDTLGNYNRLEIRISPDSFITFKLPESNTFEELIFEENKVLDVPNDMENIPDLRNKQNDEAEYRYFEELSNYLNTIVKKPIRSRYQVADLFEAGLHAETTLSVAEAHRKKENIQSMMASPYFARLDLTIYAENVQQTFYIGYEGFDGDGKEEYAIASWTTKLGKLFEKKENIFNTIIEDPKLGKVKMTFARNIEINHGKIIKLHKPFGETIYNEALIDKLASKHGIDMEAIVETIEAEQSEIIRQPIRTGEAIVIQGSAGSGKSAIALQRISFLLNEYRDIFKKEDSIAFFGPNELFLKHISRVLPRLGTYRVKQTTYTDYLKDIVSIKHTKPISDEGYIAFKGSIEYKNFIEFQTNSLLNNLMPWNEELYISEYERVTELDILSIIDKSLQLPYKERRNMVLNQIEQKIKESILFYEELIVALEDRMQVYITQEVQELIKKNGGEEKEHLSSILSNKTLDILVSYELQVKGDKRKNSSDTFYYSPLTSEAKELSTTLQDLFTEDIRNMINNYMNEFKQSFFVFDSQIYSFLQPFEEQYIKMKKQIFISKRLSEHFKYIYPYLITPLQELLESEEITSIRLKVEKEFEQFYLMHAKEEIGEIFQKVLRKFEDLWKFTLEDETKKLIKRIYLRELVEVNFNHRVFNKPSVSKIPLEDSSIVKKKVVNYLESKWFESPEDVYKVIMKDPYNIIEKYDSSFIKQNQSYITNKDSIHDIDLPALFTVYLIMNGKLEDSKKLNYLIVDEVQDYLEYELWCLTQLTKKGSMTLLGDLGQNLARYNKLDNWESYAKILGNVSFYNLKKTYRSTKQIVEYSNHIIEPYSKGKFELPNTIFREGPEVKEKMIYLENKMSSILTAINELENADDSYETIAILCHDDQEAKDVYEQLSTKIETLHWQKSYNNSIRTKYIVSEVKLVKGLEFDCVIIPDVSLYEDNDFERRLAYVGVSRALHELHVLYTGKIPFNTSP